MKQTVTSATCFESLQKGVFVSMPAQKSCRRLETGCMVKVWAQHNCKPVCAAVALAAEHDACASHRLFHVVVMFSRQLSFHVFALFLMSVVFLFILSWSYPIVWWSLKLLKLGSASFLLKKCVFWKNAFSESINFPDRPKTTINRSVPFFWSISKRNRLILNFRGKCGRSNPILT